jgi:hypothetical protein
MTTFAKTQLTDLKSVEILAREFELPTAEVLEVYNRAYAELELGSLVTKFVSIFATRNAREILRERVQ